jgi:hypothetical protein
MGKEVRDTVLWRENEQNASFSKKIPMLSPFVLLIREEFK